MYEPNYSHFRIFIFNIRFPTSPQNNICVDFLYIFFFVYIQLLACSTDPPLVGVCNGSRSYICSDGLSINGLVPSQ